MQAEDHALGRLVQFDERSRNYPIRAVVDGRKPRGYTWRCGVWLNQGREGACVGYSIAHDLIARPRVTVVDAAWAQRVYREAQKIDEWPDDVPYEGTSLLAGMKIATGEGHFAEYRWAFGLHDLILAVGYAGPALLGIPWYVDMYHPGPDGFVRPTGHLAGGHAILCTGVNVRKRIFRLHNSWGPQWGHGGDCFITFDDLERLLYEQGEAVVPLGRKRPIAG